MDIEEQKEFMEKAVGMLKRGSPADAVQLLEKVYESGSRAPACLSILGLALARSGGDMIRAERLCLEAIKKEFYWAQFYRNLAELYLLWGKKSRAIRTIERGLKIDGDNVALFDELNKLGIRKRAPIPFLSRANPLNKLIGRILFGLGLRKQE